MIHTYQRMLRVIDTYAPQMQRSLHISVIASILDGIIFALLFPLLQSLGSNIIDPNRVWLLLGAMAILLGVETLLRWNELTFSWLTANDITYDTRLRLGEQLRRMPPEDLHGRQSGELNVVLNGNVSDIVLWLGTLCTTIIQTIVVPIVTVLVTLLIDWRLAIVMALIFPLAVPCYRRARYLTMQANRDTTLADAETANRVIEYAQGLPVLKATQQVGAQSRRLQAAIAQQHQLQRRSNHLLTLPQLSLAAIVEVGLILLMGLGIFLVISQTLSIFALLALLIIAFRFSEPLSVFASFAGVFDIVEVALERIDALLRIQPLSTSTPPATLERYDIVCDRVTFSYTGNPTPVVKELSCHLPEKSFTALVGSSGSGKTTLTRLMMRYADPQSGSIQIGGIDIRNVTPEELLRKISVVFQEVYLFDDTVLNNIRLAKSNATDAEVIAAAQAANCHDFIQRLPQGYETKIGDIGSALSGGERQRISIARAILKDAPIVILDEPTSALDTESEVAVQRAIEQLVLHKTVIVIAHRLSTIVAADQILVLETGKIVEQGTHQSLLEGSDPESSCNRYRSLWVAQQAARHWRIRLDATAAERVQI
jgi:ATP-binding cassette, subfamily B, bacterial IrtB/YbtQ